MPAAACCVVYRRDIVLAMARTKPSTKPGVAAGKRSAGERTFVLLLSGGFLGLVLALSGMQAQSMMARSRSRETMGTTLEQVSRRQADFRVLNGRFATWEQLESQGERLDPALRIVRSNATESHWYMQLLDPVSGLVCDRIYEMGMEVEGKAEQNTCREASAE